MSAPRIVIVEDDRIVARDIAQQLLRFGYTVVGMTNRGDEAMALAAASEADLVLMDIRLQGPVDGIEAAQQIHERCRIPIVFLTAYADEETVRRASLSEPFGYLLKPFEDLQLRTVIGMALSKHAAEQRLRASERRYAVTLASIGEAVIATDEHLRIDYMNPVAEALTGWQAAQALGIDLDQVFRVADGVDGKPIPTPMAAVVAAGRTVTLPGEVTLMARDGRAVAIAECGSPIIDERGRVSGLVLVFRDVTARRQADQAQARRATQERIEQAVHGSHIGVWELNLDAPRLRDWSISVINIWNQLGYTGPAPTSALRLAAQLIAGSGQRRLLRSVRKCMRGSASALEFELAVRAADGSQRWMLLRAALRSPGQRPLLLGTCVDVTDRTRAEHALREGEQRWKSLAEALPHLIWTADADGRIDFLSPQCFAYFGADAGTVDPWLEWIEWVHEEDRERCIARWNRALQSGEKYDIELRLRRHDGEYFWFNSLAVPFAIDGQVRKWFGTSTDISERKAAQQAMLVAKVAAENASWAKNQFLANISHELRTPLNGILGHAQILRRDPALSTRNLEGVEVIEQSGGYLLTLINDILDFSRIEARKLELEIGELVLDKFLQVIVEIMRLRAREKGLELICRLAPDLPNVVRADERRLRQVLLNLLANAVKFTDHGQVILSVSFEAPDRLSFAIEDTGIGIAAAALDTIFEAFEQTGDLARRPGGAGLGLAISRQLMRLMGSDIEVSSTPGQGSLFRFMLQAEVVEQALPTVLRAPLVHSYPGERKRVLVADDVAANRMVAVRMLNATGFDTVESADGMAALEVAAREPLDLILIDAVMPKLDGLAAIRALRANPRTANVPIIAVSANVSGRNQQLCLTAGADAFLDKPIDWSVMFDQVARLLRLEWTYAAAASPASGRRPSRQVLEQLHRLALQGNMSALIAGADELSARDEDSTVFCDEVRRLAKGFQSRAVLRMIEQGMREEAGQ